MKHYKYFPQKKEMCLASCIQSILDSRDLKFPRQEEISPQFKTLEGGLDLDEQELNKFLNPYKLQSRHYHPSKNLIEPDFIIRDALDKNIDNLVAYFYDIMHGTGRKAQHISLVRGFEDPNVYMLDPEIGFKTVDYYHLVSSIIPDIRCGFYLIGTESDIKNF
jgi:hypothetical protein